MAPFTVGTPDLLPPSSMPRRTPAKTRWGGSWPVSSGAEQAGGPGQSTPGGKRTRPAPLVGGGADEGVEQGVDDGGGPLVAVGVGDESVELLVLAVLGPGLGEGLQLAVGGQRGQAPSRAGRADARVAGVLLNGVPFRARQRADQRLR